MYYGEMTWEEITPEFFGVMLDQDVDPKTILTTRAVKENDLMPYENRGEVFGGGTRGGAFRTRLC